jgi:subtilisin-like proprotein convertase family protein
MNTTIRKVAASFAACAVLIAGGANAQTQYRSGSGGVLNDAPSFDQNDTVTGLPGTVTSFTFSTAGDTIGNLDSIDVLGLNHTYMGDLTMSLTHVQSGTSVVFYNMNRFNRNYFHDLNGSYAFTDRSGANSIVNDTDPVSGEYEAFDSNGDGSTNYSGSDRYIRSSFDAFDGLTMNTGWRLDIWDRSWIDRGSIIDWGITASSAPSAVPEPGEWAAMGVLGFGLVGLVVRGRRRLAN